MNDNDEPVHVQIGKALELGRPLNSRERAAFLIATAESQAITGRPPALYAWASYGAVLCVAATPQPEFRPPELVAS